MFPTRKRGIVGLAIATEEAATGVANNEIELVFYAKINDLEVLGHAKRIEDHEQWELRIPKTDENGSSGRMRVRKTVPVAPEAGLAEYVLTVKTKAESGETEVANPSSEDAFNQFKSMSGLGMVKRRYVFDIPGRPDKWEVDTYADKDGNMSPWVKIDLEITDGNFEQPPFPEGLIDESTLMSRNMKSFEVRKAIEALYDEVFITKNPEALAPRLSA